MFRMRFHRRELAMLRALRVDVALLCLAIPAGVAMAAEPARRNADAADAQSNAAYGLIFCYAEMRTPEEFLKTTPCVTGGSWRCTKEDDKFWYGELHYPTENTGDYNRGNDSAPQYYMVMNVAVKKQEGLPIDVKKFEGALVLRDSKPETPLAMRGDGTSYELVGYEDKSRDDAAYNFLFANHKELKYSPPKTAEK
jgi:hypothetical protein